jgi:hypothetical protein
MLKSLFSKVLKRGQTGQSLVIIALGFVGLLAFVGIVTDVSLMFVRFSQLTRAVDSASIAAAGQVRRTAPNDDELHLAPPDGAGCPATVTVDNMYQYYDVQDPDNCVRVAQELAFARSFANVGVAARQFIEFYGLSPRQVLVDMCATVSRVDTATNTLVPIDPGLQEDFDQLCTNDQRKLIRVTAQIESPTIFLRLLGWGNILLQASSLSETAVLDVVLILDVSESMANQTTYKDWAEIGYGYAYMPRSADDASWATLAPIAAAYDPARYSGATGFTNFWQDMVQDSAAIPGNAQREVNDLLTRTNTASPFYYAERAIPGYTPTNRPRSECQVRFQPFSTSLGVPSRNDPNDPSDETANLRAFYNTYFSPGWQGDGSYGGFVPTYNYFGCCNDPNGDMFPTGGDDFGDLICQPFKKARDATERFLHRIDFFRGDRVSFVTFDRRANILYVDPDGPGGSDITHMIESEPLAIDTLQRYVGVRAETSFYTPSVTRPYDGTDVSVMPWSGYVEGDHIYNVYNTCPFHDAVLPYPYSAVSSPDPTNVNYPTAIEKGMYPRGAIWDPLKFPANTLSYKSYDLRASCGGGNIGAALRDANDALLRQRTRRTEGAVWVMVMISDGAAGVSDPVQNGGGYVVPDPIDYPYTRQGFQVTYGGFGLCPAGAGPNTTGAQDQPDLVDMTESNFPYCSDELPETRHFCFAPEVMTPNELDVTNGLYPNCEEEYDTDDYARDWADFVTGIRNINQPSQSGLSQLPTIFTIGFGFDFALNTDECMRGRIQFGPGGASDLDDCLGEELLRYIADVGDNFQIDTDYQQAYRNGGLYTDESDYGPRGPCEQDIPNRMGAASQFDLVMPLQAGLSCGNYFNAPDEEELNSVFDEIASRMFTRLTR